MNNIEILKQLRESLQRLVEILSLDINCQWTTKFKNDLMWCEELLNTTPSKEDIYSLSSSIRSVFQGFGSFNDYAPGIYNPSTRRYESIPGTEDFEPIANKVFDLSVDLHVIE
jgi:hypothetical protein